MFIKGGLVHCRGNDKGKGIEAYSLKVNFFDGGRIADQDIWILLQRISETVTIDFMPLLLKAVVLIVAVFVTLHYSLYDGIKAKA